MILKKRGNDSKNKIYWKGVNYIEKFNFHYIFNVCYSEISMRRDDKSWVLKIYSPSSLLKKMND